MSWIATFILIIIILFFIGIGYYFFYKLEKKLFTIKFTHWLLVIYLLVLVIATVIFPFMSDSKSEVAKAGEQDQEEVLNELYAHLKNGDVGAVPTQYLVVQQTFEHDQKNPLQINTTPSEDYGIPVFIEKKSENDGVIEAFVFRSALTVNEMDFSEIVEGFKLKKSADSLTIHAPTQEIHVSISGPSFPIRQLTGYNILSHTSSSTEGTIYLRVPSDLKIISSNTVYLNYVKK